VLRFLSAGLVLVKLIRQISFKIACAHTLISTLGKLQLGHSTYIAKHKQPQQEKKPQIPATPSRTSIETVHDFVLGLDLQTARPRRTPEIAPDPILSTSNLCHREQQARVREIPRPSPELSCPGVDEKLPGAAGDFSEGQ
jgi:hypothetical protein